jgi:hypothetical protein
VKWFSELKTVRNESVIRYYIKMCDVWRRVSKDVYQSREADADRSDTFLTTIKNGKIYQFKTVYGEHNVD